MSVGFLPFLGRLTKTVCHRNARQCIWQTSLDDKTCNSSLLKKFMKERTMSDEVEKMMSLLPKDGGKTSKDMSTHCYFGRNLGFLQYYL